MLRRVPALAFLLLQGALALALDVPTLERRVTDLAGVLSAQQAGALEEKLRRLEETDSTQVAVLIIPGLDYRFSWSSVPDFVVSVSNALVLLGFLVVFFVFKINSYTSATIGVSQGQKVVSTGVYSVVRHPMYAGAILILIFMPLSLDSLWGLIPAFFISIFVVLRLLDEEKVLMNELDGYKEYCEKTRYHLIPYIW